MSVRDFLEFTLLISVCPSLACGLTTAGVIYPTSAVWFVLLVAFGFSVLFLFVLVLLLSLILWGFSR